MAAKMYIEVTGLSDMQKDFAKAAEGLSVTSLKGFDATFKAASAAVAANVHVLTGRLLASGRADSHYDGDEWSGEIQYASHPGIFELARGNKPTGNHPEGGHFFFNAVEPFIPALEENINAVFDEYFKV